MTWRSPLVITIVVATASAVSGCETPPAQSALGYSENAKRAYDEALEQFNAKNWLEAQTMMREVKRKYSYSKYARMAELRIADSDMEQDKQSDAIREYKEFVRAHPADEENVAYARSRIAEAAFSEIPSSFLAPSPEERDQASILDAFKELKGYLADYPSSKQSDHIRDLVNQATELLVRHEIYVAQFYLNKDNFYAAVARLEYAIRTYGSPQADGPSVVASPLLISEAQLLLGETYMRMHRWSDARLSFETVLQSVHDEGPTTIQARHFLAFLRQKGV